MPAARFCWSNLTLREDVRQALKASFLSEVEQTSLFDQLFDLFWSKRPNASPAVMTDERLEKEEAGDLRKRQLGLVAAIPRPTLEPQRENPAQTYSNRDDLTTRDFSTFTSDDVRRGERRLIRSLAPKLASALSRRQRRAPSGGQVDLRRSMVDSVRHGGEVVRLFRRRRRVRNLRLVVLCDVSGSMDVYSRFLVQFLYALQNELRGVLAPSSSAPEIYSCQNLDAIPA